MAQHPDFPTDSKKLATLKVLCKLLNTVHTDNGYEHNLTENVWRGRYNFDKTDTVPAVAILENIDPDRYPRLAGQEDYEHGHGISFEQWTLLIQGWVVDDKCNPTDPAYALMADVRKALALINKGPSRGETNEFFRLGGLVTGMTMEPGVARPPAEQLSSRAYFWMRITLKFVEDPNDPYDHDIATGE